MGRSSHTSDQTLSVKQIGRTAVNFLLKKHYSNPVPDLPSRSEGRLRRSGLACCQLTVMLRVSVTGVPSVPTVTVIVITSFVMI